MSNFATNFSVMEVNIKQAVKALFHNPSFEMVYYEALANALDAGATEFDVTAKLSNKEQIQNLSLTIRDNGVGFTEERFSKFGKLFAVEEKSHKGLGRLVYLCYFESIRVESYFDKTKKRTFTFSDSFKNESIVEDVPQQASGTTLTMQSFSGQRLSKWDNVNAGAICKMLLEKFYLRLYKLKLEGKNITIKVKTDIEGINHNELSYSTAEMPELKTKSFDVNLDLFNKVTLYYNIKKLDLENLTERKLITAIGVDDRTHVVDVIAAENMPQSYEMIFLLISDYFQGNVDETRQNLKIEEPDLQKIKKCFREAIADVVNEEIPQIAEQNDKHYVSLETTYPHLCGYFNKQDIGYLSQQDVLKKAQDKYFRDQRDILGASTLTDEQLDKSMELSARSLAEYILFRQNVIKRLKSLSAKDKEKDLHNIIAPQHETFEGSNVVQDIYRNNVWLMDDKFMSYCTVLSEAEMTKVIDVLTNGESKDKDDDRPDITLFFSGDPTIADSKVDVVIVELKRLGISAETNSIVEFQLDTRTIQLAKYYQNHIQRMWFYGIVDMDEQYKLHLINNEYTPLFSTGSVYYKSKEVYTDLNRSQKVIQNSYIMDYTALVEDADNRNSTFLKIIRNKIAESNQ